MTVCSQSSKMGGAAPAWLADAKFSFTEPLDQYLRTFSWNKIKYRVDRPLGELMDLLQRVCTRWTGRTAWKRELRANLWAGGIFIRHRCPFQIQPIQPDQ